MKTKWGWLEEAGIKEEAETISTAIGKFEYAHAMHFSLHHIILQLQPYIREICTIWHDSHETISLRRVLPDTCVELFINFGNNKLATVNSKNALDECGSFINSRMSCFMDVQMMPGAGCVAICFHPGAAHHFFNVHMGELANANVSMEDLWKRTASELEERIAGCATNDERVAIAQQYILALLAKNYAGERNEFDYALWQINLHKGQVKIGELAKKLNIGQRQLSRQFNAFLGLSPKEYARVSRFVHAMPALMTTPQDGFTQTAYETGYYDQAHFIHDCKEFTGLTPGELVTAPNIVWCDVRFLQSGVR